MNNNALCLLFGLTLAAYSSVASAGEAQNNQESCAGGVACGTLTISNLKMAKAINFYSDLKSGASTSQINSGLISKMKGTNYFDQSPFNSIVQGKNQLKLDYGTLDVANLGANQKGIVTYTFLGASAYNTDTFTVTGSSIAGSNPFNNQTTAFGTTITDTITGPGPLGFKFTDVSVGNDTVSNGCIGNSCKGAFGILDQKGGYNIGGKNYVALLVYNDTGSKDGDLNDMIIGVNSKCISPVPEPESYGMMMVGLGLMGFMVRRKKSA